MEKVSYGYCVKGRECNYYLHIILYTESLVRIAYTNKEELPISTIAVTGKCGNIVSKVDGDSIYTNKFKITANPRDLTIRIYDLYDNLLHKVSKVDIENISLHMEYLQEKGFYGLGEKYQWLNHKATNTSNWNSDLIGLYDAHSAIIKEMHTSIPFYIGIDERRSYGIYFDNSYRTSFDFLNKEKETIVFKADGGSIDYYFMYHERLADVVKEYTWLTGRTPMPRKDFLGYQQSRYSYKTSEEVLEIARRMREESIPCDILYLDIHYMENYKVFTVDSKAFKGFKAMLATLKKMGFKVVLIIDPGVKVEEGYAVYEEGKKENYFVKDEKLRDYVGEVWPGPSVFPDFIREKVRTWWGQLHKEFIDLGIEGIWNDMNEPSNFSTESKTLPLDCLHEDDEGNKRKHKEIHNMYGMYEAIATYEGLLSLNPEKRPFLLTRAAFAGTQRYAALWTGDNTSIWEHLEISIPMLLNLGLSGFSFAGPDVGGFTEDANGELLSRWTQVGAFTPFFRNHSNLDTVYQEPWAFDKETLMNTKMYIRLRYKWITYLYNLMVQSCHTGEPALRPIFYHHQEDKNAYNIYDQFLYGEKVLICPILRPFVENRMIYLPKGVWYDYWKDEKYIGGEHIIKNAPLDNLPIFIEAGAILPQDDVKEYIDTELQHLNIHFYSGKDGSYKLYLDDGISFNYKKGVYAEVLFTMKETEKQIVLKANIIKNDYPLPEFTVVVHGIDNNKVNNISLNGDVELGKTMIFKNIEKDFNIIIEKQ